VKCSGQIHILSHSPSYIHFHDRTRNPAAGPLVVLHLPPSILAPIPAHSKSFSLARSQTSLGMSQTCPAPVELAYIPASHTVHAETSASRQHARETGTVWSAAPPPPPPPALSTHLFSSGESGRLQLECAVSARGRRGSIPASGKLTRGSLGGFGPERSGRLINQLGRKSKPRPFNSPLSEAPSRGLITHHKG
jgi:hypothetical protein